ncbi:MAG: RNA-binding domain-containing protein [Nitrososphaerales archaeon]
MSMEVSFASAEIEIVMHATEDTRKLLSVIESVFDIKPEAFTTSTVKGHFGNEIMLLRANLNSQQATGMAYKIAGMMGDADRIRVHDNFELYTDDRSSLHIRIGKQNLFEQRVVLSQTDSLKIKLKTVRGFQPKSEIENYKNFFAQR